MNAFSLSTSGTPLEDGILTCRGDCIQAKLSSCSYTKQIESKELRESLSVHRGTFCQPTLHKVDNFRNGISSSICDRKAEFLSISYHILEVLFHTSAEEAKFCRHKHTSRDERASQSKQGKALCDTAEGKSGNREVRFHNDECKCGSDSSNTRPGKHVSGS